jgi:CubicO group peptidase (beta-lactamase class C family)
MKRSNSMRVPSLIAVACIALLQAPAWAGEESRCGLPATIADGWEIGAHDGAIANPERLCALIDYLGRPNSLNIHAVVLVRNGRLLFEHYRKRQDERLSIGGIDYKPELKHDVRSISKSVVSLLVGIAIDRRLIASVDEPVYTFFPELASLRSPEKDRILVRHLLTMSSGIKWNEKPPFSESGNSERRMTFAPDSVRYVFEQPMANEPGKVWNYSGGSTTLLAAIVEKVTEKPLLDFAREALFTPLGISDVEWRNLPSGQPAAAFGLRLRPRDLAKIGQLVLSDGSWNGNRIVSAAWLQESIEPKFAGWYGNRYGYQWWLGKSAVNGRVIEWIAGFGFGGQRVFIIPQYDAVVVVTAAVYTKGTQDLVTFDILNTYLLPAMEEVAAPLSNLKK